MKDINDTVAANIVREMKKRKTKQIELAEAIGVTKQMMSKMLNGTRHSLIAADFYSRNFSQFDAFNGNKKTGRPIEEIRSLYNSYIHLCRTETNPEPIIKVRTFISGSFKRISVPMVLLPEDIYSGKYIIRRDGDLQNTAVTKGFRGC